MVEKGGYIVDNWGHMVRFLDDYEAVHSLPEAFYSLPEAAP